MSATSSDRDLVIGITPFHEPNAALVVAVERAGYLGVLDLGAAAGAARAALDRVRERGVRRFGVRVSGGCAVSPDDLPAEVDTVVVDLVAAPSAWRDHVEGLRSGVGPRVLAEVTSPEEAASALRRGVDGLVARGFEAGGRVGELSTFVLLQRLLAESAGPVWAAGGIGPLTAAAAVAGGARGVVIDAQLALVAESGLPAEVAGAIAVMDGSETRVIGGFRVYARPGLPGIEPSPEHFGSRDLRTQVLTVGQDGAFAAPLAARYRTAGGVVRAVGEAITSQIRLAAEIEPLSGAAPVQGPMTRVSDRASFAGAVAGAGGLPFLALALMPEQEVSDLLAATAEELDGLPWGVGILGFAPPEVGAGQLAAILDARPPYALIAGGRPSQAAALEEAGIETFLHVPSPGLLDQFLAAGARRFVFEGAECGGHIGPRGSFALWEAQVSRLLEEPELGGVRAWFGGGVHDERSAAMVAALTAPLVQRGAQVSVLMGTAYLFTSEIVDSGAIRPLYQQAARDCGGTALLETSPGHVIRCAGTPYVSAFAAAKQRLAQAGAAQQEAWAELEQLSLGRLRIAAKGIRRDGEARVTVDEATAREEGMFMLGQVAAMRSQVTTVAALHEQVTAGATRFLAARAAQLPGPPRPAEDPDPLDVAIVGMACVYPGADGLGAYWANIVAGTDSVSEVPAERWRPQAHPGVPTARGGFLSPVPFDALGYNLSSFYYTLVGPVVAAGARAVLYDLRGHGRSERPPAGYTTRDGVADLCALLDALGPTGPAYVVGNSYGGLIATGLALAAPERVAGLALIEAACSGLGAAAWMEDILNTLTVAALSLEHEQTAARLQAAGQRKLARLAAGADSLLNGTSLIEDLGTERPADPAALEAISCPVLAVYGGRSELRPAADDLRRHVPDARIEIIPGLAHTVLREATALLSTIVLDWLRPRQAAS